jgi:hypothetical protein
MRLTALLAALDDRARRLPAGAYSIRTGNAVCRVTKLR